MGSTFVRMTRSGRSFLEMLDKNDPEDLAVVQLDFAIDMGLLAQQAVDDAEVVEQEGWPMPLPSASVPLATGIIPSEASLFSPEEYIPMETNPLKRRRTPSPETPSKHFSSLTSDLPRPQRSNNRRRRRRRAEGIAKDGHPRGSGKAFEWFVLTAEPIRTHLESEELPIAEGGWVAANCSYYGAKVKRELEKMKAQGFTHIPWKGKTPICAVDSEDRVVLVAAGGPNDPSYWEDAAKMSELMLRMGADTQWEAAERHSKRGDFPSVAHGWSYGKGQPMPQRLGGKRQKIMAEFVRNPCVRRVARYQSASFALWFPKAYGEFQRRNAQLKVKIPEYDENIEGSVYSCCTANCGPNTWTHIHRDTMNATGACCAITSGGPHDPTKGGQLIIWDLKLIFDFPPGSTILLPSALFRHSNIPVQKGDKRVSFTQYTAGGIHRWLEYGGRTEEAFELEDPEGYSCMKKERCER
ncbi:hypothetical protein HHX47_DHR4000477 [Lentinula edodes]|nr:hypothetical protein HHX47_DHR4000477 [Lentinula edodes]